MSAATDIEVWGQRALLEVDNRLNRFYGLPLHKAHPYDVRADIRAGRASRGRAPKHLAVPS